MQRAIRKDLPPNVSSSAPTSGSSHSAAGRFRLNLYHRIQSLIWSICKSKVEHLGDNNVGNPVRTGIWSVLKRFQLIIEFRVMLCQAECGSCSHEGVLDACVAESSFGMGSHAGSLPLHTRASPSRCGNGGTNGNTTSAQVRDDSRPPWAPSRHDPPRAPRPQYPCHAAVSEETAPIIIN